MELSTIGKYKVVELIGRGAMGEVYKALDPVLSRHVAIKTLTSQLVGDADMRKRFEREAQSAARLNHPNIVTVYELGEEAGHIYIAMELLDGRDLKDLIGTPALEGLGDKLRVMEQVLSGLAFAHGHDVVHRDLKPANIRMLSSGQVKVMDFGLARISGADLTQAGMVLGTPHYMSPEQVRGERADACSDVFALGAVFYELLTGFKPFGSEGVHTTLTRVLREDPAPLDASAPDVPGPVVAVVQRALEKDRSQRYAHAGEMLEGLRAARVAMGGQPAESSQWGRQAQARAPRRPRVVPIGRRGGAAAAAADYDADTLLGPEMEYPPTLLGPGATMRGPAGSRAPLYALAGGVGLLLAAGGGYLAYRVLRPAPPPTLAPADFSREQSEVLRAALLDSNLELARLSLENKAYDEAIAQAEQALAIDPQSAAALDVRDRARAALAERDRAVTAGRAALARRDVAEASKALTRLLVVDPRHPAAAELSSALNASFRAQADEARRGATGARSDVMARQASAFEGFAEAEKLVAEGEALLRTQEFAVATQKFTQARDAYGRAQRAAAAEAAVVRRAEAQRAAEAARLAEAQRAAAQARAQPPATLPPPSLAPSLAPPPSVPVVTSPAGATQEPAIRRVLADYARAIESKDIGLFKAVKPNLTDQEQKRLADSFKVVKSQQVRLDVQSVQVEGGQASVRVSRMDTVNGQATKPRPQTFRLVQTPGGWKIDSIGS